MFMLLIFLATIWFFFFAFIAMSMVNSHRAQKRFEQYAQVLIELQKNQMHPTAKKRGPYKKRRRLEHKKNPPE